jgi:pimeloyl-ACP methyl ester carboxylesterase
MPESFCEVGGGITLCYEEFGDPTDPTALLIMGLGTQMVAWHEDFCNELAARGLHVVRFDNRDTGRSTHIGGRAPNLLELLRRRRVSTPYTLTDMAEDTAGLLGELDIAPAHVIGASMGGMIAQTLAVRHPEMVRSLVSIMSSTGARRVGRPALRLYPLFLRRPPNEREAFVAHAVKLFAAIGSSGIPQDTPDIRALARVSFDRGHDAHATARQLAAIIASGDRTEQLGHIRAPTLVIHGTADRLITPSGGRATAQAIPNARMLTIKGMGHDLPRAVWTQMLEAILENVAISQRAVQPA